MVKKEKISGNLTMGLFVDGSYIRVVWLKRVGTELRVANAENIKFDGLAEFEETSEELFPETEEFNFDDDLEDDDGVIGLNPAVNLEEDKKSGTAPSPSPSGEPTLEESISGLGTIVDLDDDVSTPDVDDGLNTLNIDFDADELNFSPSDDDEEPEELTLDNVPIFIINTDSQSTEDETTEDSNYSGKDNLAVFSELLCRYPAGRTRVAVSIPEPQAYFFYFENDWGLKGKKLKQKIIEKLSAEKPDAKEIQPNALAIIRSASGSIIAIVREPQLAVVNLFNEIRINNKKSVPKLTWVESAEISLVNLIKKNYYFENDAITIIVYVGFEFSRLIFMQGNELYHVAPIIGEGADSFLEFGYSMSTLANTIHSRLFLEQDNLNIPKIDNIILCGEACKNEFSETLAQSFSEDVHIENIKFPSLDLHDVPEAKIKELQRVSVALGAAWRIMEKSNSELYAVNIIPAAIREGQKFFKLGTVGWTLLLSIPVLTYAFTAQVGRMRNEISSLQLPLQQKEVELARLEHIKIQLDSAQTKLGYYKNTFGVLDSMVVGTQTWSTFYQKVVIAAQKTEGVWILNQTASENKKVTIKGMALRRSDIPRFAALIGNAELKQVVVQEIRERTVYGFEIEAALPQIDPPFLKSSR